MAGYRWWISYSPDHVWNLDVKSRWLTLIHCGLLALILCIPQVARVVGVASSASVPVILSYPVWMAISATLVRRAAKKPGIFQLMVGVDVVLGQAICVALPVLSGDPSSPLWALAVLYAGLNGGDYDYDPALVLLWMHALTPLIAIPLYLLSGVPSGPAVGGPLFFAVVSMIAYHFSAERRVLVRAALAERGVLKRQLAEEQAMLERTRIARDLHDSVGASLSTAALYAGLFEARKGDPDGVGKLADALSETTREGLRDLRSLLDALSPDELDAEGFRDVLHAYAERVALPFSATADVIVKEGGKVVLPARVRSALARVLQESLSNALRHGGAQKVAATLEVGNGHARMTIDDDGSGFRAEDVLQGRGLPGMRNRMRELGGTFEIAARERGTRVCAEAPL